MSYNQNDTVYWFYTPHDSTQRVDIEERAIIFIQRLTIHIPEPNFRMIRYYGFYATKNVKQLGRVHKLLDEKYKRKSINKVEKKKHLMKN